MSTFVHIWALLSPKTEYTNLMNSCKTLWDSLPLGTQRHIYSTIRKKKTEKIFVDYNPLLAIRHNMPEANQQVLSFAEYYAKYGTTEDTDGWRRVYLPERQTTIFVRG